MKVYFPECCTRGQQAIRRVDRAAVPLPSWERPLWTLPDGTASPQLFVMRVGLDYPDGEQVETREVLYCPFCGQVLPRVEVGWEEVSK